MDRTAGKKITYMIIYLHLRGRFGFLGGETTKAKLFMS